MLPKNGANFQLTHIHTLTWQLETGENIKFKCSRNPKYVPWHRKQQCRKGGNWCGEGVMWGTFGTT